MKRPILKLRAFFVRTKPILLFTGFWFAAGIAGFRFGERLDWSEALLSAFYFEVQPGKFAQGYAFWGQSLLFGVFAGLLVRETLENSVERCRAMSTLVKDHTIIVGYSHLGERIVAHCLKQNMPYVVIEKNKDLVDELLRRGEPVIVDDARSKDALPAANIAGAKRLIVASNNIETALLIVKHARDANPKVQILVRCHYDEFTDVLKKLGADKVYSTSEATFGLLAGDMQSA